MRPQGEGRGWGACGTTSYSFRLADNVPLTHCVPVSAFSEPFLEFANNAPLHRQAMASTSKPRHSSRRKHAKYRSDTTDVSFAPLLPLISTLLAKVAVSFSLHDRSLIEACRQPDSRFPLQTYLFRSLTCRCTLYACSEPAFKRV